MIYKKRKIMKCFILNLKNFNYLIKTISQDDPRPN